MTSHTVVVLQGKEHFSVLHEEEGRAGADLANPCLPRGAKTRNWEALSYSRERLCVATDKRNHSSVFSACCVEDQKLAKAARARCTHCSRSPPGDVLCARQGCAREVRSAVCHDDIFAGSTLHVQNNRASPTGLTHCSCMDGAQSDSRVAPAQRWPRGPKAPRRFPA